MACEKVFPHQFRPNFLRSYRNGVDGERRTVMGPTRARTEVVTLEALYKALPRSEIESSAAAACPRTFGVMYDKLSENLQRCLCGVFGDYGIKIMLDMLVMLGGVPGGAISRWPVDCPGYQASLATLFPELPPSEHLMALYWVHRSLGQRWRFEFPESCAQLCWDRRRVAGSLDDMMDDE